MNSILVLLIVLPLLLNGLLSTFAKTIRTTYAINGPVKFTDADTLSRFTHTCGETSYVVASSSKDGTIMSFQFTGTGIALTLLTDTDRGRYTIFIDGAPVSTVSGTTNIETCTTIYSINDLSNGPHNFSLWSNKQDYNNGLSSSKLEFIYFDVTVPGDDTGSEQNPSNSLPAGTIATITVGCVLAVIVCILGFFLYRARRRNVTQSDKAGNSLPSPYSSTSRRRIGRSSRSGS